MQLSQIYDEIPKENPNDHLILERAAFEWSKGEFSLTECNFSVKKVRKDKNSFPG